MADSVVSFLLENITRLLEDELKLLSGVESKVISLRNELKFIDIFLKSSMGKRNDEFVKEVVNQIRDVAFKAEDVIDIYVANVATQKSRNVLSKLFHLTQHAMVLHEVDAEIGNVKSRIQEIYDNKEKYGITQGESKSEEAIAAAAAQLRKRRKDVEEKDVVGLVQDSNKVIQQLMQGGSGRKVVSIIGMGGLGKTTLARKIYNNDQIKKFFPTHAWGFVSDDYKPKELWLSLLKCLLPKSEYDALFSQKPDKHIVEDKSKDKGRARKPDVYEDEYTYPDQDQDQNKDKDKVEEKDKEEVDVMSEEELKLKVAKCLKGKRYLIVLDDIWKIEVWKNIKDAFPDDDDSFGRIMITSREAEVANYAGTTSPYHLPYLNEQQSWELFSKKVFQGKECPSDLEPLGRSIAKSCKGLPLSIVVLAGLIAKKEISEREWTRIKKITWHLQDKDKIEAMDILKLSYDNLPQRLKPCFLYFGIYPGDYEINAKEVIQMWMAEGFIQPDEAGIPSATDPEDIADFYLDELVDRSLVQVVRRRRDGGVKTCRIHDLLRDFCISESKSYKFMEVLTELNNFDTSSKTNLRRLSIHYKEKSDDSRNHFEQLFPRSLFFFYEEKNKFPKDVLKSFKLARVLYFISEEDDCSHWYAALPVKWNMTIHLKYLRIDKYYIDIPASVSRLWNLETFDVKYARKVSSKVWMLKRLKHLYIRNIIRKSSVFPKSHRKIKANLETLWLGGDGGGEMIPLLKNGVFPKLRKLVWEPSGFSMKKDIELPGLEHLSNLQHLKISSVGLHLSSEPMRFASNLTKITLEKIYISCGMNELIPGLRGLTNLQILKLRQLVIYGGPDLNLSAGDFPQLQVFEMKRLAVKSWRLEEGAMPSLRHLVIDGCYSLDGLPPQLWSLTTLRKVHVLDTGRLADSLHNVEVKNGCELLIFDH